MSEITLELLRAELDPIRADVIFIRNQSTLLGQAIGTLHRDVRLLKSAVNDLARENVTPGEISALHDAVDDLIAKQRDLEARIMTLEQRDAAS